MDEKLFKMIRVFLIWVNILFILIGGVILGICVWIVVNSESLVNTFSFMAVGMIFVDERMFSIYILIGFGFLLTLLSIIGCIGAARRTTLLLALYSRVVFLLLFAQVAVCILMFIFYSTVKATIQNSMGTDGKDSPTLALWRILQISFSCCGFDGYKDWKHLPSSCCKDLDDKECLKGDNEELFHTIGCIDAMANFYWIISGIFISILSVQNVIVITSCCLYHHYKSLKKNFEQVAVPAN